MQAKLQADRSLLWAKGKEAQRTHTVGKQESRYTKQANTHIVDAATHPKDVQHMARGVVNVPRWTKSVQSAEAQHKQYTKLEEFEDSQINMVNTDNIYSNAQSSGFIAKLKTSSFHNSINVSYKIDTGSNSNMLQFCIFKILLPKSANKLLSPSENKTVYKKRAVRNFLFNIKA